MLKTNKINNVNDEALMIGDTKYDVIGVKNFNKKTVVIIYGYGIKEELLVVKLDFVVDTPTEILQIIKF